MVTVEFLVRSGLQVAVGFDAAVLVAADRQLLVDVDGYSAHGVDELLQPVDVDEGEVVHLQPRDAFHALFQGLSAGVGGGADGLGHLRVVAADGALPDGVDEPFGVVPPPGGESLREELGQFRSLREGHVLDVAGDLDDGRRTSGGVDGGDHDGVGAGHVDAVVVLRPGCGAVRAEQEDVEPRDVLPRVVAGDNGGTTRRDDVVLLLEHRVDQLAAGEGVAGPDGQRRADAERESGDDEGAECTAYTKQAENSTSSTRSVFGVIDTPQLDGNEAPEIDTARGFSFGWFANDSGQISSVNFSAPVAANDEARAQTEQYLATITGLPVIFPNEKVGTGASWTVESRITGQSTMLQTITYTLKRMTGNVVDLDVAVKQRPSLGALKLEEGELKVIDSQTTSKGTLTVDLTKPLPTGKVELSTRVIYGKDGDDMRVVQDTTTAVEYVATPPTQ